MALSATEEAQARQLIDQLAALLSLAQAEPLISSKLGAQKVNLSQLPTTATLNSDDILLVRQGTQDKTATFGVIASTAAGGAMLAANNLSDVVNKQTAFDTIKQPASELASGVVEVATDAECAAGSDDTRVVTPKKLLGGGIFGQTLDDPTNGDQYFLSLPTWLGGWTLQWGKKPTQAINATGGNVVINLPVAIAKMGYIGLTTNSGSDYRVVQATIGPQTLSVNTYTSSGTLGGFNIFWFCIGKKA
ncbi:MAG: hypothetical protein ACTHKB_15790 [Burkholderiaceae bacterium]